jgi:hypothetical protein
MNVMIAYILGILTSILMSGKPQNTAQDSKPKSDNQCDAAQEIARANPQIPPANISNSQSKKEKKWWPTTLKQWVEVLGVCVLVVYTVYTIKLYHAASEANKQAQRNSQLDQRAWMAVSEITPSDETKSPWEINIVFKNTGRTPAKNFSVQLAGEPIAKGVKPSANEEIYAAHGLIAPDGFFQSGLSSRTPFNWQSTDLVVHGKITYDSVFGHSHWTQFCYHFVPKSASRKSGFTPCDQGNDVDDNEP